jgi:hypothetical protein
LAQATVQAHFLVLSVIASLAISVLFVKSLQISNLVNHTPSLPPSVAAFFFTFHSFSKAVDTS